MSSFELFFSFPKNAAQTTRLLQELIFAAAFCELPALHWEPLPPALSEGVGVGDGSGVAHGWDLRALGPKAPGDPKKRGFGPWGNLETLFLRDENKQNLWYTFGFPWFSLPICRCVCVKNMGESVLFLGASEKWVSWTFLWISWSEVLSDILPPFQNGQRHKRDWPHIRLQAAWNQKHACDFGEMKIRNHQVVYHTHPTQHHSPRSPLASSGECPWSQRLTKGCQ